MFESLKHWIVSNPPVGAAVIAGVTSLVVALLTQWLQPWRQRQLEQVRAALQNTGDEQRHLLQQRIEELKSQLDERRSAASARRDYEYEARKRLYDEVEPVRFQVYEALEEAHYRVRSLARTARSGNLGAGPDSWVGDPGYYLRSTIYKLLSPIVHFRLLQRLMTFTDFNLDRDIALQYSLLKLYVRSFTDDFEFAALAPTLRYEPNHPRSETLVKEKPAVFSRQALVLGDLECIADMLIGHEHGKTRVLQFGEFEKLLDHPKLDDNLQEVLSLFISFSPDGKPILARLLLAQACFAHLILSTYRSATTPSQLPARLEKLLSDPELPTALAWADGKPADLAPVRAYWQPRLERLDNTAFVPTGARYVDEAVAATAIT